MLELIRDLSCYRIGNGNHQYLFYKLGGYRLWMIIVNLFFIKL